MLNKPSRREFLSLAGSSVTSIVAAEEIVGKTQANSERSPPWDRIRKRAEEKYNKNEANKYIYELQSVYEIQKEGEIKHYEAGEMLADRILDRNDTPLLTQDINSYRKARNKAYSNHGNRNIGIKSDPSPQGHDPAGCTEHDNIYWSRVIVREEWGLPFVTPGGTYIELKEPDGHMELTAVTAYGGGAIAQIEMGATFRPQTTGPHEFGTWVDRTGFCARGGHLTAALVFEETNINAEPTKKETTIQEIITPGLRVNGSTNYSDIKFMEPTFAYDLGLQLTGEVQVAADIYPPEPVNPIAGVKFADTEDDQWGYDIWSQNIRTRGPECIQEDPSYP